MMERDPGKNWKQKHRWRPQKHCEHVKPTRPLEHKRQLLETSVTFTKKLSLSPPSLFLSCIQWGHAVHFFLCDLVWLRSRCTFTFLFFCIKCNWTTLYHFERDCSPFIYKCNISSRWSVDACWCVWEQRSGPACIPTQKDPLYPFLHCSIHAFLGTHSRRDKAWLKPSIHLSSMLKEAK